MINSNNFIDGDNLSIVWGKVFDKVMRHSQISPLIVSISDLSNDGIQEIELIRKELDCTLREKKKYNCETVASTIFPKSLWNPVNGREVLYENYLRVFNKKIKKYRRNRDGQYFHRLISYNNSNSSVNQLEHIIKTWLRGNHRRSALQAGIFNPHTDHTNRPFLQFPCIQQIAFTPLGSNGRNGLTVSALIPNQYIFERAYGNYLGLIRLGQFMAHEMGLVLNQMICFLGTAQIGGNTPKRSFKKLHSSVKLALANIEAEGSKKSLIKK